MRVRTIALFGVITLGLCPQAWAQGDLNVLLTPAASDSPIRVFSAKTIHTMERANPTATAVAVQGDRIVAVGSLDQVRSALADRKFILDESLATRVLIPGLIEQHLH